MPDKILQVDGLSHHYDCSYPGNQGARRDYAVCKKERVSGNKWNVPVGFTVSKAARMGGMISKFELGFEYSVVREDAFGQRALVKLSVIPVIPRLIRKPLFAGR